MIPRETIQKLHDEFCRLTDATLTLHLQRMDAWQLWAARGLTLDDLKLVVWSIRKGIAEQSRNLGALRFSALIQDPDRFEEELGLARAQQRNTKPARTNRERTLAASGRPVAKADKPAVPAGEVAERLAAGRAHLREFLEGKL